MIDFNAILRNAEVVPHPVVVEVVELPGVALANGNYHGFGSKLCKQIEDATEEFGEDTEDEPEE